VIENDGRPVGTRTPDLYRVKTEIAYFVLTVFNRIQTFSIAQFG